MRSLAFLGLLTSVALIPAPVAAQSDSGAAASNSAVAVAAHAMRGAHRMRGYRGNYRQFHRGARYFGPRTRFYAGGFVPRYYLAPRYYVINWAYYGLGQPGYGHHWVRHYNDAYMVDRHGRVSDSRYDVGYDGHRYHDDRGDSHDYDDRRGGNAGDTVAGAIAGGVIGGVAGNLIAGEGDRTEGTIIGAAVGAIAGGAIGNATGRDDQGGGYDDNRVPEYVGDGDFYPPAAPGYGHHGNPYLGYHNASSVQTTVTVNGVTTHASQTVGGMTQSSTTTVVTGGCCGPRTTVVTSPQNHRAHRQGHSHMSGHHASDRHAHSTSQRDEHPHTAEHHAEHPHPHGPSADASQRDEHPHTAEHHAQHPHQHGPSAAASVPNQLLPDAAPQLDVPDAPQPVINFIEEEVQ